MVGGRSKKFEIMGNGITLWDTRTRTRYSLSGELKVVEDHFQTKEPVHSTRATRFKKSKNRKLQNKSM